MYSKIIEEENQGWCTKKNKSYSNKSEYKIGSAIKNKKRISIREIKSYMQENHSVSLSNDTISKILHDDLHKVWKPFTKTQFLADGTKKKLMNAVKYLIRDYGIKRDSSRWKWLVLSMRIFKTI